MEDKNKKPVDTKQLKKPTGTSVTGKPLDGIEIRPQLKGLGNRQHNEDTVVLTDTLAEKKAEQEELYGRQPAQVVVVDKRKRKKKDESEPTYLPF